MEIARTDNSVSCSYIVPQSEARSLTGYLALYNSDGVLVDLRNTELMAGKNELSIEIENASEYRCSAFIWDDAQQPVLDKIEG